MAGMRFVLQIPTSWLKLLEAVAAAENVDKRTALIWIVQEGLQAKAREHGLQQTAA
jgi:hypothetical protein